MTDPACTCGNRGICLDCQLADLKLAQLLGDRFVRDTDRALRLIDNGLTERDGLPMSARARDSAPSRSVSPANVVPLDSWSRRVRP